MYATLTTLLGLWGVPYLTQVYGLGRVAAANTTAWLAAGIVVGAPLVGWLSDRRLALRKLPLGVCTGLYAACWLVLVAPSDLRAPVTLLGPLFLFCNAPIFLALALLQWLTGAILDAKWAGLAAGGVRIYPEAGYRAAFVVCLAVAAGSLVSTLFVTETRCRNIWKRAAH